MIEERVHAELKRQGGWRQMTDIALALDFDYGCVTDALGRLKRRGAVEKRGDRLCATWMAVEAVVEDRRQYNQGGRRYEQKGHTPKPKIIKAKKVVKQNEAPVHASTLAQALAWQP